MLLSSLALAADPIALEVVPTAQEGLGKPGIVLIVNQDAERLEARVDCGGAWAAHDGGAKKGDRIALELSVPAGHHSCSGKLAATFMDGSSGEMPLSFEVDMFAPLSVEVPRDSLKLETTTLSVVMDRTPERVDVDVFGPRDAPIGSGTAPGIGTAAGEPLEVQWTGSGEVVRIHVKGTDEHGYWSAIDLFPWAYQIPHEDVVFDTNQSVVRPGEAPKLEAAMVEVGEVRKKYGPAVPMNLYVAGYTDTVGDPYANQQLSNLRAASIAAWFRDNGFEGEIYFQGFGESVLAVDTPDSTDEPGNRRALYLLSAETPPMSTDLPRRDWQRL
ncbi:MAG TPA: OmpA family protein [Myxococcota bacterium]|nr:OmpA family protein [Myxococcota bacterium]